MRLIDADELIRNLEGIISDYTSNGIYPEKFGIDDFIDVVKEMPIIPAPQWISVEDRPPERNGEYIVTACDEGEPSDEKIWNDTVVVCAEYYKGCWTWEENNSEYSLDGIVTHWMPMPEPPKERYKCRYADDNGVCSKCSANGEIIYCVEGPCPYDLSEEVKDE